MANQGSLDWDTVEAALYNEAFAGRAKVIPRCCYCLAYTKEFHIYLHAPKEGRPAKLQAEQAPPRLLGQTQASRPVSIEICRLFNSLGGSHCRFRQCRYVYMYSKCRHPHSAAEFGDKHPQASTPPGTGSPPPPLPLPPYLGTRGTEQ